MKSIKLPGTKVLVTTERYKEEDLITESGLYKGSLTSAEEGINAIKPTQYIVNVSDEARNRGYHEGQLVQLDLSSYEIKKQKKDSLQQEMAEFYTKTVIGYSIPSVELNNKEYLILNISDIEYIIEEYEFIEVEVPEVNKTSLIQQDTKLIMPGGIS